MNSNLQLNLNYNLDVEAGVYFEIYDKMPATLVENVGYVKKEGLTPLYSGYTQKGGVYKGTVELPSYMKTVYIYTPAFYAQTVIEANIEGNTINATATTDSDEEQTAARRKITGTYQAYYCYMDEDAASVRSGWSTLKKQHTAYEFNWHSWLGSYYTNYNGKIDYEYNGELRPSTSDIADLYEKHQEVINIDNPCPQVYRSYSDLKVNKDAEVVVSFVGQNTCWNSSIGYYYYQDGEAPTSLNKANVVLLFPNTQDGNYTVFPRYSKACAGINRGTTVQLMYYPNIASGSKEGATTVFPKGTRIGFVLATNAWGNRLSSNTGWGTQKDKGYRAATSEALSVNDNGVAYGKPRTAVYRTNDYVVISFEDYESDENFSDVVITTRTNPLDAIVDVPPADTIITSTTLKGMYAFEDLWPSKGDYDMNDVVIKHTVTKYLQKDEIIAEAFNFKTYQNYAQLANGLAIRLDKKIASTDTVRCFIKREGETTATQATFTYEPDDNVFILTDNVKNIMGAEYTVTISHASAISESEMNAAHPFIWRASTNGLRREIHIAHEAPTSKVDASFFGTEDDQSVPAQGIYYVRSGIYPFAFYLSGADETSLSPLLKYDNESTPLDHLFPKYAEWVNSGGTSSTDWYSSNTGK